MFSAAARWRGRPAEPVTPNGLAALIAGAVALVAVVVVVRGRGALRWIGIGVLALAIAVAPYASLEGMGAFCDPPPGAGCM
jgi:hypothetical protein